MNKNHSSGPEDTLNKKGLSEAATETNVTHCSLWRRLAAIAYDLLLLIAILFVATIPLVAINRGHSIVEGDPLFTLYLTVVIFLFYGWFWTHGGQTLGMRTWRVKVQTRDGKTLTWGQAFVRFIAAAVSWLVFGLGFVWSLFDKDKLTWHDRFSETELIVLPK
ncbi:MAG: hypothetical protein BMS9Abin26_0532 [Gammaproteobacteria bacterium]|nr:MAG: hypothetical protein BMS9Abin26_0532 [Gammaproteobacteria bacterium]